MYLVEAEGALTKKTHGDDDMSKYMPCEDANLQANNGAALAIPVPTFMIFLTPYKMCKNGILTEKDSPLLRSSNLIPARPHDSPHSKHY